MSAPPNETTRKVPFLTEQLAAPTVAMLLILTALGSAWLMFAVALIGVAVGLLVLRRSLARSSILIVGLAAFIAFVIAVLMWRL